MRESGVWFGREEPRPGHGSAPRGAGSGRFPGALLGPEPPRVVGRVVRGTRPWSHSVHRRRSGHASRCWDLQAVASGSQSGRLVGLTIFSVLVRSSSASSRPTSPQRSRPRGPVRRPRRRSSARHPPQERRAERGDAGGAGGERGAGGHERSSFLTMASPCGSDVIPIRYSGVT